MDLILVASFSLFMCAFAGIGLASMLVKEDTTDEFERTVSDYIAGMTDRFAIQLHNNLR